MPIVLTISIACLAQRDGPSIEALKQVVLESYAQLGGLSCEYEGRAFMTEQNGPTALGREWLNFSGAFAVGIEKQSLAVEQFQFYVDPALSRNNFHKVTVCWDGRKETLSEGPHGGTGGEIGANWAGTFDETGSLERIMPINTARCYFQDRNYEPKSVGADTVDGHSCYRVEVHLTQEVIKKHGARNSLIVVYWFDLERGGHALKADWYSNRKSLNSRLVDVILRRFNLPQREVWLPVEGKYQFLNDDGSVRSTENYQVLQSSVRLSDLAPDRFKAKFKPGTPITDQLRHARYEFGQDLRPPPTSRAEAQKRLSEQIEQAEAQKAVLDASRVANEGFNWPYALILVVTATSVIALTALLVRRR